MKTILTTLFVMFCTLIALAQDYESTRFDYENLITMDTFNCSEEILEKLEEALIQIEQYGSKAAIKMAESFFKSENQCPPVEEVYALAFFRNGDWMRAKNLIDSAVLKYGAIPSIIDKRANMCLEMAEIGYGARNVDGNSLYLPKSKQLKFDEAQFKQENYLSALHDFTYLMSLSTENEQEIYTIAYIHQQLGNYKESLSYYEKIQHITEIKDQVSFSMIDNYIGLEQYEEAEKILTELETKYPKEPAIQKKFIELFKSSGQTAEMEARQKRKKFHSWVPVFLEIPYNEENYNRIRYFLEEHSPEEKIGRLEELVKQKDPLMIDILIDVLYLHVNHGNGVEEAAEKLIAELGAPAVEKLILLLNNAQSTCTVTKAASTLAEIKDPRGWEPLVNYLPRLENLPFTVTPPHVTTQLIKFDREKALVAILQWLKGQKKKDTNTDDPLAELGSIFSGVNTYQPLSVYKKNEIVKAAKKLKYTKEEQAELLENVFGD